MLISNYKTSTNCYTIILHHHYHWYYYYEPSIIIRSSCHHHTSSPQNIMVIQRGKANSILTWVLELSFLSFILLLINIVHRISFPTLLKAHQTKLQFKSYGVFKFSKILSNSEQSIALTCKSIAPCSRGQKSCF